MKKEQIQYRVTGMSCAACSAHVEKAVRGVEGVESCSVNLLTGSMVVDGAASKDAVCRAVAEAGYMAEEASASAKPSFGEGEELKRLFRRLCLSLIVLLVLMYGTMGHSMLGFPLPAFLTGRTVRGIAEMILALVVMIINRDFFTGGFRGLFHLAPNMDTLVAIGSAAAFGYSLAGMYTGGELYFESAAMIPTFLTIGKLLEAKAKGRTTDALKGLAQLSPKTASLIREGQEVTVPVSEVCVGDIFVVRPGERIPVDGVVLDGESAVNEAVLTGESIPVDKAPGDFVSQASGNQSGFLRCRAERVGEDTTLSQIIRMVSDAAVTKAPLARIADKVSGVFVPAVMGIALLTCISWLLVGRPFGFAFARGISVLVISCPCALGLATPVAIMVGSGHGARNGILYKTAQALENMGKTETVVLDKTGTLTSGVPVVTDLLPAEGVTEEELLQTAVSLEAKSEHPLAKAVLQFGSERGILAGETEGFRVLQGNGLIGTICGSSVCGGNRRLIETKTSVGDMLAEQADRLAEEGKTPLWFEKEGALLGVIAAADTIKPESPQAVKELRKMGLEVIMLTGDNEKTAQAIGRQAGITCVAAGVLPQEKEAVIQTLQKTRRVAMVGDGINDAPALTRADTGVAIGAGTDIAVDAADVVLVKSRLTDVPAAIRLSRAVIRNIHENLFWAFFYNLIGIPLAAGVYGFAMKPVYGAAAMSLSSFCVCMNALRINRVRVHDGGKDRAAKRRNMKNARAIEIIREVKKEKTMEKTIRIEGMMCGHCEAHVKKALEALPGVASARADHTAGSAVVTLAQDVPNELLTKTVEDLDYKVTGIE